MAMNEKTKLGNVNAFVQSTAWIGRKSFNFDGTIKGLTRSALGNGAVLGTVVLANIAGRIKSDARKYVVQASPNDPRAHGFWAVEA
jgi:hypothetical protein